jgi:hypothetical protein
LRQAVARLPAVRFAAPGDAGNGFSIQLVDGGPGDQATGQPDQSNRGKGRGQTQG